MGMKNVNTQSWSVATTDPALKVTQTGDGFAADFDGAVAATVVGGARDILSQAVWWVDAQQHDGGQVVRNLGCGGSVLNATAGSGSGVDTNDPAWLSWTGTNYVYLPGSKGNSLTVPDSDTLTPASLDLRAFVALDDWTPSANNTIIAKRGATTSDYGYALRVTTTGALELGIGTSSTTAEGKTSTASTGFTDGVARWIRATKDATTGDVKFYTSEDGVTWTQLGATVSGTATAPYNDTNVLTVGDYPSGGSTEPLAGKVFRAQILNGIGGTTVLDVDTSVITSGSQTQFVARTGQIVSVNRSTSGRKSVCVVEPCWLFGTDDYMEVADNSLIDFSASDSFSVMAVVRQWATPTNAGQYVAKRDESASYVGWGLGVTGTNFITRFTADTDTLAEVGVNAPTSASGASQCVIGTFTANGQMVAYLNGVAGTAASAPTGGTMANSKTMRIGSIGGGASFYQDFEIVAAAVFRRVLTPSEIAKITAYYAKRGPSYVQDHVIQGDLVVTGALGYGTGAGGTVTQATSKATGVTLNKPTGQITMNNAALNADTTVSFTLTNNQIAATDLVLVQHVSGGTLGSYTCTATAAAGSATVYVRNVTAGNLSEAVVLQFAVVKAVTA